MSRLATSIDVPSKARAHWKWPLRPRRHLRIVVILKKKQKIFFLKSLTRDRWVGLNSQGVRLTWIVLTTPLAMTDSFPATERTPCLSCDMSGALGSTLLRLYELPGNMKLEFDSSNKTNVFHHRILMANSTLVTLFYLYLSPQWLYWFIFYVFPTTSYSISLIDIFRPHMMNVTDAKLKRRCTRWHYIPPTCYVKQIGVHQSTVYTVPTFAGVY